MVGGAETESSKTELQQMAEALQKLEKKVNYLAAEKARAKKSKANVKCFHCGEMGHYKSECPKLTKSGNEAGPPNPQ